MDSRQKRIIKKNNEYDDEDYIDIINIFRTLILEVMIMSKGLSYDNLINMTIKEFLKWYKESLRIYKVIKGITTMEELNRKLVIY